MIDKLRRILIVGNSACSIKLKQQLHEESQKYSCSIDVYDSSEIDIDEIFESTNSLNHLHFISERNLRKGQLVSNAEPGQLLAAAYIQDIEHQCESKSLLFHDNLHVNQLVWNRIQRQLLEHEYDSIVFLHNPQDSQEAVLYQVAKAIDIKTYILIETIYENRYFSFRSLEDCGQYRKKIRSKTTSNLNDKSFASLQDFHLPRSSCDDLKISNIIKIVIFLMKIRSFRLFDSSYIIKKARQLHDAPNEIKYWRDPYANFFGCNRISYFDFLSSDYDKEFISNNRFVFFPLQPQQELISELLINHYADQLLAIEQLARILPKDCKILIKGCSNSKLNYLTPMFFHRVNRISNVVKVPSCIKSTQLIKNCELLATINSDLGWQALNSGKRILIFGHPWYRKLPGVFEFEESIQYNSILNYEPNSSELETQLKDLLSKAHKGKLRDYIGQNRISNICDGVENSTSVAQTIFDLVFGRTSPSFHSSKIQKLK